MDISMSIQRVKATADRKKVWNAAVTVEASAVFSLFLLFFFCLLQFYMIFQLEMRMQNALEQTADMQAAYILLEDNRAEEGLEELLMATLDTVFAKANILRILGIEYLENSPIRNGAYGLDLSRSNFLKDGETICLKVTYQLELPFFPLVKLSVVQCAKRRVWIGADSRFIDVNANEKNQMVYIARTGGVYHLYEDCPYIKVVLEPVHIEELTDRRNPERKKYYPCESCKPGDQEIVYIASYRNCYHAIKECPAIVKSVDCVKQSEVGNRQLCSRCAERK